MQEIKFVTSNPNKVKELSLLLTCSLESVSLDVIEIQGSSQEIANAKLMSASKMLPNTRLIVEDTSLTFLGLSNEISSLPGPYVKMFLQSLGCQGMVNLLYKFQDKRAVAMTIIGYTDGISHPTLITPQNPNGIKMHLFEGKTFGSIVEERGKRGFGWDGIFMPDEGDKTYAEMEREEKSAVSHRGRSARLFNTFIESE